VDGALARASGGVVTGAPILQQRCDSINHTYRIALSSLDRNDIVCQHDAYGYLAERYHLDVVAVIQPVESGEVSPGDLKTVVDAIHKFRIGAIFVEPGAPSPAAQRVAEETGVRVFTLDPLGDGDWPKLMNDNLEVLLEGLSARAPTLSAPTSEPDAGEEGSSGGAGS
jgi:zinc transport system substrate-binding protein